MKKFASILMTLCLLCASCAALADTEPPVFSDMPGVVLEDENTTVDKAAFNGTWVLNAAFLVQDYLSPEKLDEDYHFGFEPIDIADGKLTREIQDDNGEFHTAELDLTFDCGQLSGEDGQGYSFVLELLEDGNIVLSVFIPGENDEMQCLSLFLQHPDEM